MKNILLILAILFVSSSRCQDSNILTKTEYDNIKINGKTLKSIRETNGLVTGIQNLFGTPTSKNIDPDGEFNRFVYPGFTIGFSSIISSAEGSILSGFQITNNQANLTVKGVTVTIGDHISKLGNVAKNLDRDGSKSILYQGCWGCNNFIAIDYNQLTGIITKIYYIEMT